MTPVELGIPTPHGPPALPVLQRRASHQVMVGDVAVGGGAPITVQSMTTKTVPEHQIVQTLLREAKQRDWSNSSE